MRRYLKGARDRLNAQLDGIELDLEDVYAMQTLCPYEVRRFSVEVQEPLLTQNTDRLWLLDIPSFASSSLLKSGKDLITRKSTVGGAA